MLEEMPRRPRNRSNHRDPWQHLTPEVAEIVKSNLQKIHKFMESPNGEGRKAAEGQNEQKEKGQRENEDGIEGRLDDQS
jgi:hypothetical protein